MMQFAGKRVGVLCVHLVQTDSPDRLAFYNTNHGYTQSIIDFYTPDLPSFHRFLKENNVKVNTEELHLGPDRKGGFGFFDPDGNSFGTTNVVFPGQGAATAEVTTLA